MKIEYSGFGTIPTKKLAFNSKASGLPGYIPGAGIAKLAGGVIIPGIGFVRLNPDYKERLKKAGYVPGAGIAKLAAHNKTSDWVPSFNQQDRGWGGAIRDTGLALGAGGLVNHFGKQQLEPRLKRVLNPIKSIFPSVTRSNIAQARESRQLAQQFFKDHNIDAKMNIGTRIPVTPKSDRGLWGQLVRNALRGGNAAFLPSENGPYRAFTTSKSPYVALHEAGHIANADSLAKRVGRKNALRMLTAGRGLSSVGALAGLGSAGFAEKDSWLNRNAWWMPIAGAAPLLADEALASKRGLDYLKKIRGAQFARKGIPGMAAALGTYALLPAGSALSAYTLSKLKPVSANKET